MNDFNQWFQKYFPVVVVFYHVVVPVALVVIVYSFLRVVNLLNEQNDILSDGGGPTPPDQC